MTDNYSSNSGTVTRAAEMGFGIAWGAARMGKNLMKRGFDTVLGAIDPDVASHLINSNKEMLLAVRSVIDWELRMADRALRKVNKEDQPAEPAASEIIIQPT